jgi:hypothetical protein
MNIRRYLKKVGITSQREIENAVRDAITSGKLTGTETLAVKVSLKIGDVDLAVNIEGDIGLE